MMRALLLLAAAPLWAQEFRAGRAAVKITPPTGVPMAGYYNIRLAEGVHDDLHAKAVVLQHGETKAALVVCDLISMDAGIARAARAEIAQRTGVPPAHVMISATHSHTGPLLNRKLMKNAPEAARRAATQYLDSLPARIAEAVVLAHAGLAPARAALGRGREDSVAFNRRFFMKDGTVGWNPGKLNPNIVDPAGPIDPDTPLLYLDTPEGKPLAAYVNYALHLDTVGGTQVSADYPYTLANLLRAVKGPDLLTVFSLGACGNINHIDVKSKTPQKGHGEAERIGTVLAGEAIKTFARAQPVAPGPVRGAHEVIALPARDHNPADVAAARDVVARFGTPKAAPFLDQVKAFRVLDVAERGGKPVEAEIQAIAFGDEVAWVGLPGEIFVELGMAVKQASPFPLTIVVELANGSVGYVPDRRAYAQGAYEVVSARVNPGSGEQMVETALRLLRLLRGGK